MIVRRDKLGAVVWALVSALSLGGCGSSTPAPHDAAPGEGQRLTDRGAEIPQDVDYVAIGPRALLTAIEPLLQHREARGHVVLRVVMEELTPPGGSSSPELITNALRKVASRAGARLKFVLLVGDVPGEGEDAEGFVEVPTAYRQKLGYENHGDEGHAHEEGDEDDDDGHAHPLRRYYADSFPTDWPYAFAHIGAPGRPELAREKAPIPLAVGRVPARFPEQAAAFARKVIEYETQKTEGAWRRSITLFGGPANFGAVADYLIESTMSRTLDEEVPYDWDVDLIFPKLGSPYAYPFRDLSSRLVSRLDQGALLAAYVGHGAPTAFDHVMFRNNYYRIGSSYDLEQLHIGEGKPFFISITCSNGHFDLPAGRLSVAETLVLNPGGAIAAFASSRESHPYPNALYGDAIVQTFVEERAPTIGEGVVTMKKRMREGNVPLAPLLFDQDPVGLAIEHEALYNLFGDPATVLRYPARATVTIEGKAGQGVAPSADLSVIVESKEIPAGKAELTLETRRSVVRGKVPKAEELLAMSEDEAFAAMRKSYEAAMNKVISRAESGLSGGKATFRLKSPAEPGDYAIKVFVAGGGEAATGFVRVSVGK